MQQINNFFETYAKALENYDTKGLANMYSTPCTMLSDSSTAFFNDKVKLEGFFNQGTGFYRQFGIVHTRPEIWNSRPYTGKIINVKVIWHYLDVFNNPIYNCDYHYVLKLDKNNQWKIVLSVSVNEQERMEAWKGKG